MNMDEIVQDSALVLRAVLMTDEDYYNGFKASIKSALDDMRGAINHDDAAGAILDRLIGKE